VRRVLHRIKAAGTRHARADRGFRCTEYSFGRHHNAAVINRALA
jgi:hypothetical protein